MAFTDRGALLALFRSTGGANWFRNDNWDTDVDLSQWFGVDVNLDGRVVKLDVSRNNLEGTIPRELGALTNLETLSLRWNKLMGPIPPELGNLTALEYVNLWNNQLSGSIPKEVEALVKLKYLALGANQLTGTVPKELGTFTNLTHLNMSENKLNGCIPEELGALSKLERLLLPDNQLRGPMPPQLGNLVALQQLDVSENQLDGTIPKELGALKKVRTLVLRKNKLTGSLPSQLGELVALEHLVLAENQLTGHIPGELGDLNNLKSLRLERNQLTGYVPPELGNLVGLEFVNLAWNQLRGLWNHTQDFQDATQEKALRVSVPPQLCRLLDVLHRVTEAESADLRGNPWVEPPASIVGRGLRTDMEAVRRYFTDLYADPCRVHRNSVKIILVGQEGGGKTSLRQSMKANKATPTGIWIEESTVFADVEPMEIGGASVRVYDCAGQVAYTGLLQMLLTPRSVCVLVCDSEAFGQADGTIGDQVEKDCRKLEELRVCDWLRSVSRRVPDNDVVLVATKCDLVGESSAEIGRRMETACRAWLASWVRDGMQPVRLEEGVCLTSCRAATVEGQREADTGDHTPAERWACDWRGSADELPPPSLLHRLVHKRDGNGLRGNQMALPQSWDIALTVLEALERGRDPVEMVLQKVANPDVGEATETAPRTKTSVYQGITVEELASKWQQTVLELEKRGITVINPESALEGAISIREFDGSLVRHGKFIFLDVVWLAKILKPLLNHKYMETFDGSIKLHVGDTSDTWITLEDAMDIASWQRLKSEGILEARLAHALWPTGLAEYVLPTLQLLDLAFPLAKDPAGSLVVLLRLNPERPVHVGKVIDKFCSENTPTFSTKWNIFLGVPAGVIEKVLTRCCSLGSVRTFWRSGVLVHGNLGDVDGSGLFAMVLEYSSSGNELAVQVYGDIGTPAPWAVLSYAISAVRSMLEEFPGLRSRGSLECPEHGESMLLADERTRKRDQLLVEGATCRQCSPETMGRGAAAVELLRAVDIRLGRDVIFDQVKERFVELGNRYPFIRPEEACKEEADPMVLDGLAATVRGEVKAGFDGVKADMKAGFHEVKAGLGDVQDEVRAGFYEVDDGLGEVKSTLEGVKAALDKVTDSTHESLMRLKSLQASSYRYPRLVALEETVAGDASARTQQTTGLLSRQRCVPCCFRLRGVATKDMTLHFLCPVDMEKVACGFGGGGFRFRKTREWIKTISPVLQVAVVTAKVALKATAGLDADVSDFLKYVKNGLFEELVDRALDEDALIRVVTGEEDPSDDMQRDAVVSYEALQKFIDKEENKRRDGDDYVDFRDKMQRVDDGKGGMVWVRNENVRRWRDSLTRVAPSK